MMDKSRRPAHARTVRPPKADRCVYCGSPFDKVNSVRSRDHVPPDGLFPMNGRTPNIQLLTVPSCERCNNARSMEEVRFRNLLLLAGDPPNAARTDQFDTFLRSFDQVDGRAQWEFVMSNLRAVEVDGRPRHMIYPAESAEILSVVRKIVRGLCYHHNVSWPVSDSDVRADVLRYRIPERFEDYLNHDAGWFHVGREVLEYRFGILTHEPSRSWWMLTFYESCTFVAWVGDTEGWPQ